jgi:hypothetical protein
MLTFIMYFGLVFSLVVLGAFVFYFMSSEDRKAMIRDWIIHRCHLISMSIFGTSFSYDALGGFGVDEILWALTYMTVFLMLHIMKKVALHNR